MEKLRLSRVVIVEGKYDQIKLSSLIDGLILRTDGFRIYKDKKKLAMIRTMARERGAVIVTDSDRAGFQLRSFLRSAVKEADVVNVYIPQVAGKEKRKTAPGAEGLLGVEGIGAEALRELFLLAGALDSPKEKPKEESAVPVSGMESILKTGTIERQNVRQIGRLDFYQDGLLGGPDAAAKRRRLLSRLDLPSHLSANGLLEVVNTYLSYEEYQAFVEEVARIDLNSY